MILFGVTALFSLVIVGTVATMIAVYTFWKDSRMKALERQINGTLNMMEDVLINVDRETGQLWEYILSRR